GLLAQVGQDGDISAHDGLQRSSEISNDAARAHNDAPHDAVIFDDAIPRYFQRRGHHGGIHSWHGHTPPYSTFTAAILTAQIIKPKQSSFATLKARGRPLLFPGRRADRRRRVSYLAGLAMARLCAPADAHRSRIPCATCC